MLPIKFQLSWPFSSGEDAKVDFKDNGHLRCLIGTNFSCFYVQATLMRPIKFCVNWPFGSEEANNRFSRWRPWWPAWISDRNNFSNFWSTNHLDASYQVSGQMVFRYRRRNIK